MSRFETLIKFSIVFAVVALIAPNTFAARGGGGLGGGSHSFGVFGGLTQASQDNLNTLSTRANARTGVGPISTPAQNGAYEAGLQYGYRFSGTIFSILMRPSYFYSAANGTGANNAGNYNYSVTGFTIFPILRLIPLENDFMKFIMQFGLGYGRATTKIEEGPGQVTAVGDAFGTLLGLGAEFCLTASQCISLEGNYRYLTMERNIATSASGTWASGPNGSLSRAAENKEVELDDDDLKVRMGGLQFLVGYTIHF